MTCPSCGYCAHCGRGPTQAFRLYPKWSGGWAGTGAVPLHYENPAPNAAQGAGNLSNYRSVTINAAGANCPSSGYEIWRYGDSGERIQ